MKLLQFSQKKLESVGIDSTQNPFNRKILKIFSHFFICNISTSVFLLHEPNNFMEYSNSIFVASAFLLLVVCYTILITKMQDSFKLIANFESAIDKSMCIMVTERFGYITMLTYFRSRQSSNIKSDF